VYKALKKNEFDFAELQARLVWAIANGWKKPKDVSSGGLDDLKKFGMLEDK